MNRAEIDALPYRRCAGLVVVNRHGKVFAGQRIDNPGDAWQMPQGGIDAGEDPLRAALRELHEETGLAGPAVEYVARTAGWIPYDLPIDLVPKLWGGKYRGQTQKWFLFRFSGADASINISTKHPEFSRWAWMRPTDLIERIVPFKRATYARVFSEFAKFLQG